MHRDVGDGVAAEVCAIADADVHGSFLEACRAGSLPLVHELLAQGGGRRVDVHKQGEEAFRGARATLELGEIRVMSSMSGTM